MASVTGLVKDNQPTRVVRKLKRALVVRALPKYCKFAAINVRVLRREEITRSLALLNVIAAWLTT
jgi:hypothetical protein